MKIDDSWCYGPFCYDILDVCRLEKNIECRGRLGLWKPPPQIHKLINEQITVKKKIESWLKEYGEKLSID